MNQGAYLIFSPLFSPLDSQLNLFKSLGVHHDPLGFQTFYTMNLYIDMFFF
jgi:hypothetical protein